MKFPSWNPGSEPKKIQGLSQALQRYLGPCVWPISFPLVTSPPLQRTPFHIRMLRSHSCVVMIPFAKTLLGSNFSVFGCPWKYLIFFFLPPTMNVVHNTYKYTYTFSLFLLLYQFYTSLHQDPNLSTQDLNHSLHHNSYVQALVKSYRQVPDCPSETSCRSALVSTLQDTDVYSRTPFQPQLTLRSCCASVSSLAVLLFLLWGCLLQEHILLPSGSTRMWLKPFLAQAPFPAPKKSPNPSSFSPWPWEWEHRNYKTRTWPFQEDDGNKRWLQWVLLASRTF